MRPVYKYLALSVLTLALTAGFYPASAQEMSKESLNQVQDEEQLFVNAQLSNSSSQPGANSKRNPTPVKRSVSAQVAAQTFTNSTAITITDCPNPCPASGQAATLFPSPITVTGVAGVVQRASVTLNGLAHGFPADIDLLLVSPSGRKSVIMSDFGGGAPGVGGINITLDDYAGRPIPSTVTGNTGFPFVSGTYRPANNSTTDLFPAPAPASPYTYTLSTFNGDDPNGIWNLYVIDDANLDGGAINGGWAITFDVRPPAPAAGDILISEFRTRGVGTTPLTSDGSADEFIELYNNTDSSITIIDAVPGADPTSAAGAGWRIGVAQGATENTFLVISQTSNVTGPLALPARGHFLLATQPTTPSPAGNTYSLATYPTGTGITASGSPNLPIIPASATMGFLPDDAGIALFSTANALTANRLDSVGYSSMTSSVYKEAAGLPSATGITTAGQHSWVRKYQNAEPGRPIDTNNNANDFMLVETTGAILDGVQSTLGAPGPERGPTNTAYMTTSAPPVKSRSQLMPSLIYPASAQSASPNRERDLTAVTNGPLGTLAIRRCFTNNSAEAILALRYRVIDLTTLGNTTSDQADLRVLSSAASTVTLPDSTSVTSAALTLQTPSAQAVGGGINSSLGEGIVTTSAPLAVGATTCTTFTLGVQRAGRFSFFVNTEGLTVTP